MYRITKSILIKIIVLITNYYSIVDAIKSKWNYLKQLFMTEHKLRKKYIPSGSAAQENQNSFEFYEEMKFLIPHVGHNW